MYGNIEGLHITNLYRAMSMLKLGINVNLPQLLCIFVFVAQNGKLEPFGGLCIDCYYTSYFEETDCRLYGLPVVVQVKKLIAWERALCIHMWLQNTDWLRLLRWHSDVIQRDWLLLRKKKNDSPRQLSLEPFVPRFQNL